MRAIVDDDHEAFRDSFSSWIDEEVSPRYGGTDEVMKTIIAESMGL